jgi:hypothetical protein
MTKEIVGVFVRFRAPLNLMKAMPKTYMTDLKA